LCWETVLAYNKEVVLKKIFFEKIKKFNPGLPQKAQGEALDKLNEVSSTMSFWN
jgi:type I restriction enzyme R subunit